MAPSLHPSPGMGPDLAPPGVVEGALRIETAPCSGLDGAEARVALLRGLVERGYSFVTPTPATSRRMFEREREGAPSLRDIFGWSAPFRPDELEPQLLQWLRQAEALETGEQGLRSRARVSTLHGMAFLHSAFPTTAADAVFFGPDSYRFADFLAVELKDGGPVRSIVDVGAGAGVGGLVAAKATGATTVILSDVNPTALPLAGANAAHAGVAAELRLMNGLDGIEEPVDLIVANPPYIAGQSGRTYRDGGDLHGARLSLDWAVAGMARLAPGGRLMLYTGSAILHGGRDQLRDALTLAAARQGCGLAYRELDPDVFGDELYGPDYADVERIAAVGAVLTAPG